MGNILMIIGNLDMTCFGRGGGGGGGFSFRNGRWQCCLLRQQGSTDLTGYNAKLTFFGFKLIKYGIKVSLCVLCGFPLLICRRVEP